MAAVLNDQSGDFRIAMDDPYDLVLGMFALAVTAFMLVAGEPWATSRLTSRRPRRAGLAAQSEARAYSAGGSLR